jgi:hypothetical protein
MTINWNDMPEYNEAANGLKVVYFNNYGYWVVLYQDVQFEFESSVEMDEFLEQTCGISEQIMDEGYIGIIE